MPLVVSLLVLTACNPGPVQRPLEGAPVGGTPSASMAQGGAPESSGVPPTLVPAIQPASSASPGAPGASGSPSPSPSPVPGIAGFVIVATDGRGANLREGPSTSARVITTLAEGTAVETLGQPVTVEGRAWQQIRSGGREGWVVEVVVRRR
jgi:hypothetical protein